MSFKITLAGNKKVDAHLNGFTISTDQGVKSGGDGTAPSPFDLFLASLGTCAGFFVLSFCNSRNLPTEGIEIEQDMDWDPVKKKISKFTFQINIPSTFPQKYHTALVKAAEQCLVKKTIQDQPEFDITTATYEVATI